MSRSVHQASIQIQHATLYCDMCKVDLFPTLKGNQPLSLIPVEAGQPFGGEWIYTVTGAPTIADLVALASKEGWTIAARPPDDRPGVSLNKEFVICPVCTAAIAAAQLAAQGFPK